MIKDMSDADLADLIVALVSARDLNFALKRTKGMAWTLRQLDIAFAVRGARVRAGTWSL